jgi:hypothetical protein
MLQLKTIVRKMKNVFDKLYNGLDTAEERINKLEDVSIETFQTETHTYIK